MSLRSCGRNPFLDLQAYDSSDNEDDQTPNISDDEDFIAGGDDEEDASWEAEDGVGGNGGITGIPLSRTLTCINNTIL